MKVPRQLPDVLAETKPVTDEVETVTSGAGLDTVTAPVDTAGNGVTSDLGNELPPVRRETTAEPITSSSTVEKLAEGVEGDLPTQDVGVPSIPDEDVPNKVVNYVLNEAGQPDLPTNGRRALGLPSTGATEEEVDETVATLGLDTSDLTTRALADVSEVTDTVTDVTSLVTSLLSGVLSDLTSVDSEVTGLQSHAEDNTDDLATTLKSEVNSSLADVKKATSLLSSSGSGSEDSVNTLAAQVETTASKLISDLESIDSSSPVGTAVPELVSTVKTLIDIVSGLGL